MKCVPDSNDDREILQPFRIFDVSVSSRIITRQPPTPQLTNDHHHNSNKRHISIARHSMYQTYISVLAATHNGSKLYDRFNKLYCNILYCMELYCILCHGNQDV